MRAAYAPIFQGTVEETLREALARAEMTTFQMFVERRSMCMDFYHNEVLFEDGGYDSYVKNYFGYQQKDGSWVYKKKLLTEHVNLTEQIIDLKARNYREQPEREVNGEEAERYSEILRKSGWHSMAKTVERYQTLLSDVAVGVFFDDKTKLLKFVLIPEYYPVFADDDPIGIDPVAIIYPTSLRDQKTGGMIYAYYDATSFALMDKGGSIGKGGVQPNTYGTFNFFFPHRKRPSLNHFSTPAISLVQANQAVDVAMTALNGLMHYNGYKQMVIKGKIADKSKDGADLEFALGNAQVITLEPEVAGEDTKADVSVVDLQVDFAQHIDAIKFKIEAAAQSQNLQFQWKIEGGPQSGKSLEIQNVRDSEDRLTQQEVLDEMVEQPLYRIVSEMSKRFNLGVEQGELSIDWAEPEAYTSVADEIAWQKHLLETGQADEVDLMLMNNPELERTEAEKRQREIRDAKAERMQNVPANQQQKQDQPMEGVQ